jgi:hypothetical protein
MTKIDLSLDLPDDLARYAREAGLLSAREVARLLRQEVKRRAADELLAGAARATAAGSEPMSMAELNAEIRAVRAEMRKAASTSND